MPTRNVTLALPDDLVRKAKVFAAQRDTSVSALVGELLTELVGSGDSYDAVWAAEEVVMRQGVLTVGDVAWSRDELHRR